MRTLVLYDSLYGNTKPIAKAIGETLSGDVEVLHVGDPDASGLGACDLLLAGVPTHGFRPSLPTLISTSLSTTPDVASSDI
jgi:flavodoxin